LQTELSRYLERLEIDPERMRQLDDRINLLHGLRRKYGSTVAEVVAFGHEAKAKLESLEQRDTELVRIQSEIESVQRELRSVGDTLTSRRRKLAPQLNKSVIKELNALGFKQSAFDVAISTTNPEPLSASDHLSASGFDSIDFQFAPNPGEPLRPLRTIASSGEMARVMLALKTVLAAVDEVPVLIFDEVDANVAGESAHAVGEKMAQIARSRQVICITHLPQVAAHATTHFVVSKAVKAGRTFSEITLLEKEERIPELARMLGGQTHAATLHAETLLAGR
jgi:DNA repair protein RecN (Recombination protein N)